MRVVAVDYFSDAPGKTLATWSSDASALDTEAVVEVAKEHQVDAVLTVGTDQAVVTMADAADRLGLPCYLTPRSARLATDKLLMREALLDAGVPMPAHVAVAEGDDPTRVPDAVSLPAVVKPADGQGQKATCRVDDPADLPDAVAAAMEQSRSGRAVVEEFRPGCEVTVSGWLSGGRLSLLMVTDRVTYNPLPALGICFQHVFPSLHAAGHLDEVRGTVNRVAEAYGVREGPLYVQMIVGDDGVVVVEAACRVGGGHEVGLIPAVTGVEILDLAVDLALTGQGNDPGFDFDPAAVERHGLVNFLLARPGTIRERRGFEQVVGTEVAEGEYYHPAGYRQEPIVDSLGRVGYFIALDTSRDALLERARRAYDRLELVGDDGRDLLFWPPSELTLGA